MELKDKVVIITGGSSGIGAQIAHLLAAAGAKIVLAARTMGKLERIAAELGTTGAALVAIPTDVTREQDCRALVKAAIDAFGRVDVLINNAGYAPPASLHDTTEELWDATVDVCLKGVYIDDPRYTAVNVGKRWWGHCQYFIGGGQGRLYK